MSATHVFANGHEIASQAVGKSGRSSSAMPDPCWSPPAPGAGPVVIPYPNTCFADSITKGTSTVMIGGKTVAIADQSRFDTSIGNEGATQAFNKGVATGVIKGKAYFTKWSSDVVFEGYGVPRDMDLVTHNHGSQPSNTPTFPFISSRDMEGVCKEDAGRVKSACVPERDESAFERTGTNRSQLRALLKAKRSAVPKGKEWNWTHDHCDGLDMRLGSHKGAASFLKQTAATLEAAAQDLQSLISQGGEFAAAGAATSGAGMSAQAKEALAKQSMLREQLKKVEALRAGVGPDGFPSQSAPEKSNAQSLGADAQSLIADLNDCARARKCVLTPFSSSKAKRGRQHSQKGGRGCCDGQTGHHLVYGAMMSGACPDYENHSSNQKHRDAPTVCVEGVNQNVGSHGRAHNAMDRRMAGAIFERMENFAGAVADFDNTMALQDVLNEASRAHVMAFPNSSCSAECIRKQLEDYYEQDCPGVRPRAVNKHGASFKRPKPTVIKRGTIL